MGAGQTYGLATTSSPTSRGDPFPPARLSREPLCCDTPPLVLRPGPSRTVAFAPAPDGGMSLASRDSTTLLFTRSEKRQCLFYPERSSSLYPSPLSRQSLDGEGDMLVLAMTLSPPPPLRFSAGETFEGRGLMNSGKGALPPLQSLLEVKLI